MPTLVFDKCCGCIELRTGCLIIAYLNLISEILFIGLGILGVTAGAVIATQKDSDNEHKQEAGIVILVISVVLLIFCLVLLAFTIVLLVGLHKYKRGHIKAYLIYGVIFLVISIILFFASFAGPITAGDIIQKLLNFVLSGYFLLVIRSYYYKMDDKQPPIYDATPRLLA